MIADSVHFRGHGCFKNDWVGFDSVLPINVIIGRNNTGKSHLLDLVENICRAEYRVNGMHFRFSGVLDETALRKVFREGTGGNRLNGDHWLQHGRHFVGQTVKWESGLASEIENISLESEFVNNQGEAIAIARKDLLVDVLRHARHRLTGTSFRRLLADRDIRQERESLNLSLERDGSGASNIIRRFIVSSSSEFAREVIQTELRNALNVIFGADGHFSEIQIQLHDEDKTGSQKEKWEVYLGEEKKGLVSLSNSGSGLKTVILVLLNLLVIPKIEKRNRSEYTFGFEELENNLHPALLRRLLQYIEKYAVDEQATVFLTTHSSTALDLFGSTKNAQIVHVSHSGESASAAKVQAHFDRLAVISEIGAKPSDLLQANGIIWVEGPSDCLYVSHWVDIYSKGRYQNGRDYQCAFYGGSLLARTQFVEPSEEADELVNLMRVNPNVIVVCDGDREAENSRVKKRVSRIREEVEKIPGGHAWITSAREIENYLTGSVISRAYSMREMPDPEKYESFFPKSTSNGESFVERHLKRKSIDKMELASLSCRHIDLADLERRFDWASEMKKIVALIEKWNN